MKLGLRAGTVAATLIAASYGVVAATSQYATAGTDARLAKTAPVEEVAATDTATPLPGGSAGGLVIDEAHGQVFISRPNRDSVIVTDLDGQIVREITGFSYPTELAISADGGTVYVVNFHDTTIGQIDTTSYAVTPAALSEGTCPHSVAFSGGKAWYTYDLCDGNYTTGGVGVLDPATNTGSSLLDGRPGNVRALPDRPDRVVVLDDWGQIDVYDLSSDTPSVIATLPEGSGRELCRDAAFLDSGDTVVTACGSAPHHEVFHTADLSGAGSVASGENPNNVAVSPDGNVLAAGTVNAPDDIHVWNVQNGTPGTAVRSYELGSVNTNAVAFSAAGRLYAVESSGNAATLHVLEDAAKIATTVTVDVPKAVKYQGTVKVTGTFDPAPGDSATSLAVTRRDRAGEHDLGTVPVAADGGFAFNDTPNTTGPVVYVVGYAGDESHAASGAKAAVTVRPLPFDVNADGYAETVVGAYAEDIGSIRDAGGAIVFPGSSTGVKASGSKWYDQNTSGVPGAPETGDMFGFSNTSGDFNGDGYADVAISVGAENIGSAIDGGIVQIFPGSASGLRTDNVKTLGVNDTFLGAGAEKVYFGDALAAGDFNGDGRDDLAIGASGASQVFVSAGSDAGLSKTLTPFNEDTEGVPGTFHSNELFGYALSAGDINGDGRDDLAVGGKYDYDDKGWSTGSVTTLYGSESGLTGTGAQRWSKEVTGVPGGAGSFSAPGDLSDQFGHQVALADFNGDGKADLAVGAPGAPVTVDGTRKADAGTLTVLYSNGVAIGTTDAVQVSQQTSGMPGISGAKDYLGATMAAGDANGDGRAELAAYSYGDTYVTVIPGAAGGLAYGSAKGWTQNSAGIPGSTEAGDRWGNSLRFAYVKGAARASLLVGADGENSSSGAFTVIYSTSSGLTGTGSQIYTQNTTGVPGTSETGDGFGSFF